MPLRYMMVNMQDGNIFHLAPDGLVNLVIGGGEEKMGKEGIYYLHEILVQLSLGHNIRHHGPLDAGICHTP